MIAYHQSERLSTAALTEFTAGQPSLLPLAMACKDRFLPKDGGSRHAHLHDALTFLRSPSLSQAAHVTAFAKCRLAGGGHSICPQCRPIFSGLTKPFFEQRRRTGRGAFRRHREHSSGSVLPYHAAHNAVLRPVAGTCSLRGRGVPEELPERLLPRRSCEGAGGRRA